MRAGRTAAEIGEVNEGNFRREVILSEKLVLIYFEHPYDEDSRADMEMIKGLTELLTKSVKFLKSDVLYNDKLASYVGMGDKPGLVIYKDGERIAKFPSPLNKPKIRDIIRRKK